MASSSPEKSLDTNCGGLGHLCTIISSVYAEGVALVSLPHFFPSQVSMLKIVPGVLLIGRVLCMLDTF